METSSRCLETSATTIIPTTIGNNANIHRHHYHYLVSSSDGPMVPKRPKATTMRMRDTRPSNQCIGSFELY
ncbi:uncharacterized protein CC84DRAFT_840709 [Paraphaeosphaeria sporulosa]|uniref:Uncharacterized protein n=1 Tax=Paraphaeosphaeria sporulosa TaxID=1460663 RepID=A0A177C734_9PLEO|nr:uncharacterized protein CC84DRAFT_840709 [Paraphaeosphaeria sporulosa]OAG03453.1 hypothetical protein CC84DRAFT_840709 [Paraphaeosphaeria sporulosa]